MDNYLVRYDGDIVFEGTRAEVDEFLAYRFDSEYFEVLTCNEYYKEYLDQVEQSLKRHAR